MTSSLNSPPEAKPGSIVRIENPWTFPEVQRFLDCHVIQTMAETGGSFGPLETCWPIACFTNEWLTHDIVRGVLRSLTALDDFHLLRAWRFWCVVIAHGLSFRFELRVLHDTRERPVPRPRKESVKDKPTGGR